VKLSVLMSVYDKETPAHLRECLDSLAIQTLPADEVVIVEDGPLGEQLRTTIADYKRILPVVVLALPTHLGLGAALRVGVEACTGEYVARMDSDDVCVKERFQRQVEFLDRNPMVDVVGSTIEEFQNDCAQPQSIRRLPVEGLALLRFAKFRTPMNHVTVVFRKASVIAAGNYENLPHHQDYRLWAKMLMLGYRLHNMSDILVHVRCGNGMQRRRGGFMYLKMDIQIQLFLHKLGLVSASGCLRNIVARGSIRLAPRAVRSLCYRLFLRSGVPHERPNQSCERAHVTR
jgi:glycosyltransferase involved in cell wall biosynthesis